MSTLVSCALFPKGKRSFVAQAVWFFLRQQYTTTELIVIDDAARSIEDLVPKDSRIRYVRLAQPATPHEKRRIALELATGEYIAEWSETDWIGPERLTAQVEALEQSGVEACAISGLLYYFLDEARAWRLDPRVQGTDVAARTLLCRRDTWLEATADESDGPRYAMAPRFASQTALIDDPDWYLGLITAGSPAPGNLREACWKPLPVTTASERIGLDRPFYAEVRNGPRRILSGVQQSGSITLAGSFAVYDGYGSMAEYLALGMSRAGARVNVQPFRIDRAGLAKETMDLIDASQPEPGAPVLCFAWWGEDLSRYAGARDLVLNTMWETSRLPADWPARLNRARVIIVPTTWVRDVFRQSGVKVPIEVVPQGIDSAVYHYEERPHRRGLTTLIVGVFVPRKNVYEGIEAWKQAFADDPEARLIIKARFGWHDYQPDDPRILFIDSNETTRGIAHWYREADVLLALGNEGFGLPLIEGMATGLPVVALNYGGQTDVCREAAGLVLDVPPVRYVPVDEPPYGRCGERAVPGVDDIATRLRWVAEHREEARALGKAASAWVLENRDIWEMGPAMIDAMERHIAASPSLRSYRSVWAPAVVQDRAGALRTLPATRISPDVPERGRSRLLQVFFHDGAFDEGELLRTLQAARYAGVPTVVALDRAGQQARAWERETDLLLVTNSEDLQTLRLRWPQKQVETVTDGNPQAYLELWKALEQR